VIIASGFPNWAMTDSNRDRDLANRIDWRGNAPHSFHNESWDERAIPDSAGDVSRDPIVGFHRVPANVNAAWRSNIVQYKITEGRFPKNRWEINSCENKRDLPRVFKYYSTLWIVSGEDNKLVFDTTEGLCLLFRVYSRH
jgi:hypothetical protein